MILKIVGGSIAVLVLSQFFVYLFVWYVIGIADMDFSFNINDWNSMRRGLMSFMSVFAFIPPAMYALWKCSKLAPLS